MSNIKLRQVREENQKDKWNEPYIFYRFVIGTRFILQRDNFGYWSFGPRYGISMWSSSFCNVKVTATDHIIFKDTRTMTYEYIAVARLLD